MQPYFRNGKACLLMSFHLSVESWYLFAFIVSKIHLLIRWDTSLVMFLRSLSVSGISTPSLRWPSQSWSGSDQLWLVPVLLTSGLFTPWCLLMPLSNPWSHGITATSGTRDPEFLIKAAEGELELELEQAKAHELGCHVGNLSAVVSHDSSSLMVAWITVSFPEAPVKDLAMASDWLFSDGRDCNAIQMEAELVHSPLHFILAW